MLAMAVLPFVLAGAMVAWDRLVRRRRRPDAPPARWGPLWLLAFLSVLSHPLLDFLNTYGVRFLHPFSNRWFYGDALFIVDIWVWIALLVGVVLSRVAARRGSRRPAFPARVALVTVFAYVAAMFVSGRAGRTVVGAAAERAGLSTDRVLVSPVPIDPFHRMALVDEGGSYRLGALEWLPRPAVSLASESLPKNDTDPAAEAAKLTPTGRKFMVWARFPYFEVTREGGQTLVTLGDARYGWGPTGSWARVTIPVPDIARPNP